MTPTDRPQPGRHDMYYAIHRGLRRGHALNLLRLSATDWTDAAAAAATTQSLRDYLELAEGHLHSEETHIHPAIARAEPRSAAVIHAHEGHEEHEAAFEELDVLMVAVETAPAAGRPLAGQRLYARYARFAADDCHHMEGEETGLLGTLQRLFTDDQLRAIEGGIIAANPPARMIGYLALMIPALSHPERLGMLTGMRAAMPPEAFSGIMEAAVRPNLDPADTARLEAALSLDRAA